MLRFVSSILRQAALFSRSVPGPVRVISKVRTGSPLSSGSGHVTDIALCPLWARSGHKCELKSATLFGLHSLRSHDGDGIWSAEKLDQILSRLPSLGIGAHACGKDNEGLQLKWEQSDELNAGRRQDLTCVHDPEVNVALGDQL